MDSRKGDPPSPPPSALLSTSFLFEAEALTQFSYPPLFLQTACEQYKINDSDSVKEISPTISLLEWTTKKRSQYCTLQPSSN